MVERPLMVRWVIGLNPHGGTIECSTTRVTKAVAYAILYV